MKKKGMKNDERKTDERRTVASAIVKKSRRLSLEELAARGQRHVRVLTAGEAFEEIESVVDETSTKRANEIAGRDRAWVFEEAKEQFDRAARLRSDSERLIKEQGALVRKDADRVAELERKLREELQELKSSVKALEEKSSTPDAGYVETLFDELTRREESSRAKLETRLETTMNETIDAVRRTVVAALKGTGDTSVDATRLIVAKVLDDQEDALASNVAGIRVAESHVVESRVGGGVGENLARLKRLRKNPATAEPSQTAESASAPEPVHEAKPAATAEAKPAATLESKPVAKPEAKAPPASKKAVKSSKAAEQNPRGNARKSRKNKKSRSTKKET